MIIIFAGHHPASPGASYNGFAEHDEAVRWIELIDSYLDDVVITGPIGTLNTKVNYVNKRNPHLTMDLHFNSAIDNSGHRIGSGSETLYCPGSVKGKGVAMIVQSKLGAVCAPDRGAKEGWYRADPKFGPDWFLVRTSCPAIIIEPDFIHRRDEIQTAHGDACIAIAAGLRAALMWLEEGRL